MALQRTRLTEVKQISNSAGSIYTNPAATKSCVKGFLFTNIDSSLHTVNVYWVPDFTGSLGTAGTTNLILFQLSLAAGESFIFEMPFSMVMTDTNESIQASADTGSKVNVIVFGDTDV